MDFTVHHDDVAISAHRVGQGAPLISCPGLGTTQEQLQPLIATLRRDHQVISFDFRGHGASTPSASYTFDAFHADLAAVIVETARQGVPGPTLVGYSLGADLAVRYAAAHPGSVSGLVLVDGANPIPEPFLTEADLPWFRAMKQAEHSDAMSLSVDDIVDICLELEAIRSTLLEDYRRLDVPIRMIMSAAIAGDADEPTAVRLSGIWRRGIDRLTVELPQIAVTWLAADHGLIVTHAEQIGDLIRGFSVRPRTAVVRRWGCSRSASSRRTPA